MKITTQFLKSRAQKPLPFCELLELSNQEIESIDKFQPCQKLRHLNLRGNIIDYVSNLDCCQQLWKLDLCGNRIKNLDGIRRFVAMGTLILSNNNLNWSELAKIRHMHILDLSLHGNRLLEKDPHYRLHVIDILPNVWMLDGRLVTSAERLQVQQFFEDSALSDHPVRHKISKEQFTPSSFKKIAVNGVFGEQTDHLMRRFPVNGAVNIDTDKRRLKYLAHNVQEDLLLEAKHIQRNYDVLSNNKRFLEDLLEEQAKEPVRCNMILLLLVASLEFAIPIAMMQEALRCTKLAVVGKTPVMSLFLLARETRCLIVSLLLSAVKIDRDVGEDGGLYDKLYLCLYDAVSELTKLSQGVLSHSSPANKKAFFRESKCLIASEIVQLLCIVPRFFDFLSRDAGVMNLVALATSDPVIIQRVHKLTKRLEKDGSDQQQIFESVAQLILSAIHHNSNNLVSKQTDEQADYVLKTKNAIPRRPMSSSLYNSDYLLSGRKSPEKRPVRLKSGKHERRPYIPLATLGEKVLLGPQNVGRVISIPEPELVLIQMDVVAADTGAMIQNTKNPEQHYSYVDMTQLYWDPAGGVWKPQGTVGDRITIQAQDANNTKRSSRTALARKSSHADHTRAPQSTPHHDNVVTATQIQSMDQALLNADMEYPEAPETVSSKFKQMWNLKLEMKAEYDDEQDIQEDDEEMEEENTDGEAESQTHKKRPQTTPSGRKSSARMKSVSKHFGSDSEFLYDNLQSAITKVKSSIGESVQSPKVQVKYNQHTDNYRKSNMSEFYSTGPQWGSIDEHPSLAGAQDQSQYPTPSRRSSLESTDEPELERFVENSKTVGGSRPESGLSRPGTVPVDLQIEIPQVAEEQTEKEEKEGAVNTGEVDGSARLNKNAMDRVARVAGPRPISAVDSYRMIVARDNRCFTSQYQTQRLEAWKQGPQDKAEPVPQESSPPPQRPPSPSTQRDPAVTPVQPKVGSSKVKLQFGEDWLGGGRNLHWERQRARPKTAHTPGWMEGMPQRPKSAAALRALRRSKTPNIQTPSSIAYQSLYALDGEDNPLDDYYINNSPRASPLVPGENQLQGTKLVSHPFAKYVYVMRERNKLASNVMCPACRSAQQAQQADLQRILGRENSQLIGKLVALEPCSHVTTPESEGLPALR